MEDKIEVIDEIVRRHPAYGVDKGWSWYTGGMRDTGDWEYRKMLDVPIEELEAFLASMVLEENRPAKVYTEQEQKDMEIIHLLPNGVWITEFNKKRVENFNSRMEIKFLMGVDPYTEKDGEN